MSQENKIHSLAFRTLANQKISFDANLKKLVERVESHRDIYLDLLEAIDETHHWKLPELTGSIKEKALQVRQWLGVNSEKAYKFEAYRQLLEAKGLLVFQSMGYSGKWKVRHENLAGFSVMHDIAPTIFIKKTTPERQTFTLFHELAHVLLHGESHIDDEDNLQSNQHNINEQEANQFAGYCLLSDDFLNQNLLSGIEAEDFYSTLKPAAIKSGINVEVIVVALLQRGLITNTDYDSFKEISVQKHRESEHDQSQKTPKGSIPRIYRHREPLQIFGKAYVGTVLNSLYDDKITLNKASNFLDGLKISDLKELDRHYVKPT